MSNPATKIEILYPEYGNQGGDNGNALYLEACLPKENFVYTSHAETPYFVACAVGNYYGWYDRSPAGACYFSPHAL